MATIWTTPWDNWILSQTGWSYPPGSIIGRIFLVPIEEHLFFIFQPILLILLQSILGHHRLLPFKWTGNTQTTTITTSTTLDSEKVNTSSKRTIQTLQRRPLAVLPWVFAFLTGLVFLNEAHHLFPSFGIEPLGIGRHGFYMGWILTWISPILGFLAFLGARLGRDDWRAWFWGSAWLVMVDTISIRNGAWKITGNTSLDWEIWRGMPIEEFTFFLVTSYLVILGSAIITHLHTLLLLSLDLPACPPKNPFKHVVVLGRTALFPPPVDADLLEALADAEDTLKKGSKSFEVAKLAFGREMRLGLVAVYAWCRVTDNLIDDLMPSDENPNEDALRQARLDTLASIRKHLRAAYNTKYPAQSELDSILDTIPNLTPSCRSAFHLFSTIVPRLVPIEPFLELCQGYESDLQFYDPTTVPLETKLREKNFDLASHLPIKTNADLMEYADNVAGSIAAAICYLAWSVLDTPEDITRATRPILDLSWSSTIHSGIPEKTTFPDTIQKRIYVVEKAREMGRALQLVNIARDVAKDALIARVYVPLSSFSSPSDLLSVLQPTTPPPSYSKQSLPLLDMADNLRLSSRDAIAGLPPTARGGMRAMVASYFEIGEEIRRKNGEVEPRGIKVSKKRRAWAASKAMWGL